MELIDVVSVVAIICTIGQFLSGIQICKKITSKVNTANVSSLPLVAGALNCVMWLRYGTLKEDNTLILVNSVGLFLQVLYTAVYIKYSINKNNVLLQVFLVSAFAIIEFWYCNEKLTDLSTKIYQHGLVCCCCGLLFCASPLISLIEVIKTKSTESLPFLLCLANCIVCSLWFFYGYLLNDYFMEIPNFIGGCIGLFQVILFYIYPDYKSSFLPV